MPWGRRRGCGANAAVYTTGGAPPTSWQLSGGCHIKLTVGKFDGGTVDEPRYCSNDDAPG